MGFNVVRRVYQAAGQFPQAVGVKAYVLDHAFSIAEAGGYSHRHMALVCKAA